MCIARDVQQRQGAAEHRRGEVLEFALDAEDALRNSDEGASFLTFVEFILAPENQTKLRSTIRDLRSVAALAHEEESLEFLAGLVPALIHEADKVMKTAMQLSTTLRKLLDQKATAKRQRVAGLLRDIKHLMLLRKDSAPTHTGLELHVQASLSNPLTRPLWQPPEEFEARREPTSPVDKNLIRNVTQQFASLKRLDFRRLRERIRDATCQGASVTLHELATNLTPATGLPRNDALDSVIEILGLVQIAFDDGHQIENDVLETITLPSSLGSLDVVRIRVPNVTFHAKSVRASGPRVPK